MQVTNATNDVMGLFSGTYGNYIHIGAWNQTGASSKNLVLNQFGGNVGIGATDPDRKLSIQVAAAGTNEKLLYLKQSNDYGFSWNLDSLTTGDMYLRGVNAGAETTMMTFSRTGFNIGVSGAPAANRTFTANYSGTTGSALCGDTQNASYAGWLLLLNTLRTNNSAFSHFQAYSNNLGDCEFNLRGDGNAFADGSWSGGGADYAEYFESATGEPLPVGATVYLDGDMVRVTTETLPAEESLIIGVVRPKRMSRGSVVIGNSAWNGWQRKFLTDDYGAYIMEEHQVVEWDEKSYEDWNMTTEQKAQIPETAVWKTHDEKGKRFVHRKVNPLYDPTLEYVSREERTEWVLVGLLGQVPITKGQRVQTRWILQREISPTVDQWMIR